MAAHPFFHSLIFPSPYTTDPCVLDTPPDEDASTYESQFQPPLIASLADKPSHPQHDSPLFALPREIRDYIWGYALTAFSDPNKPYPPKHRFWRPWRTGTPRIAYELLMSCRAIYCEAWDLPLRRNPVVLLEGDHQDRPPWPKMAMPSNDLQNLGLRPWQFALVQGMDINVQQIRLEQNCIAEWAERLVAGNRQLTGCPYVIAKAVSPQTPHEDCNLCTSLGPVHPLPITTLTIRMNRTDWWSWSNAPESGRALQLDPTAWKRSIASFPDLQELWMILETFSLKKFQLDDVVESATGWYFPCTDGKHQLVWDGEVEDRSWYLNGNGGRPMAWERGYGEEVINRVETRALRWVRKEVAAQ